MDSNDDLLAFLVEGLNDKQRDLVTRSFYKFAQGDPDSGPVNEAVLLTACSRRVSQSPKELRTVLVDFAKLLTAVRDMEAHIRDRVEQSNLGVVASFKEEADRATTSLRATAQHSELIASEGRQIAEAMQKFHVQNESLLAELRVVKGELKTHAEGIKNSKAISQSAKEIISTLTDVACVNWISLGFVSGFILAFLALHLSAWLAISLFVLAVAGLQWMARLSWKAVMAKVKALNIVTASKAPPDLASTKKSA